MSINVLLFILTLIWAVGMVVMVEDQDGVMGCHGDWSHFTHFFPRPTIAVYLSQFVRLMGLLRFNWVPDIHS